MSCLKWPKVLQPLESNHIGSRSPGSSTAGCVPLGELPGLFESVSLFGKWHCAGTILQVLSSKCNNSAFPSWIPVSFNSVYVHVHSCVRVSSGQRLTSVLSLYYSQHLPALGLQACAAVPGCLCGFWDLNSGPHTYVNNTLQTESSVQS